MTQQDIMAHLVNTLNMLACWQQYPHDKGAHWATLEARKVLMATGKTAFWQEGPGRRTCEQCQSCIKAGQYFFFNEAGQSWHQANCFDTWVNKHGGMLGLTSAIWHQPLQ